MRTIHYVKLSQTKTNTSYHMISLIFEVHKSLKKMKTNTQIQKTDWWLPVEGHGM